MTNFKKQFHSLAYRTPRWFLKQSPLQNLKQKLQPKIVHEKQKTSQDNYPR